MNSDKRPKAYIIAGPNGAGKTTFATKFLPHFAECTEFVNADLIAGGLSPFSPERAALRAGRLMLEQIRLLANRCVDFGFETTLAGKGYVSLLNDLKDRGYGIHIFYLCVHSIDVALERIAARVRMGGHDVPEDVVRRRYHRGMSNFSKIYQALSDFWAIYDNSTDTPHLIAYKEHDKLDIIDHETYNRIIKEMEG